MNKRVKSHVCAACDFCKLLYRDGYRMYPTKRRYCTVDDKLTSPDNGCDNWKKRVITYDLSPRRLDEATNDVIALLELLKDCEYW